MAMSHLAVPPLGLSVMTDHVMPLSHSRHELKSAADRIKEPGSKSWISGPSCLIGLINAPLLVAGDADPWQK